MYISYVIVVFMIHGITCTNNLHMLIHVRARMHVRAQYGVLLP